MLACLKVNVLYQAAVTRARTKVLLVNATMAGNVSTRLFGENATARGLGITVQIVLKVGTIEISFRYDFQNSVRIN